MKGSGTPHKRTNPVESQTKTPTGSGKSPTKPGVGGSKEGRFSGGSSQVKTPIGTRKC